MRLGLLAAVLLSTLGSSTGSSAIPQQFDPPVPAPDRTARDETAAGQPTITVPAGTKVAVALTSPVWSKTVHLGDSVYAVSVFPVAIDQQIAIPPGTYVAGSIDAVKRPTWTSNRAEFQIHFTKLIFGNGYTVELAGGADGALDKWVAIADVQVVVSSRSDILLDNGSQIEVMLQAPLSLDRERVVDAARRSRPVQLAAFRTASRCVPIPATPGTSPTIIPGTPATPPTVISQGPGLPDVVIPGSPGTAPTVIGGSSGTPGVACPGPPVVISVPSGAPPRTTTMRTDPKSATDDKTWLGPHNKSLRLSYTVQVVGDVLPAGGYQLSWTGPGPAVQVDILRGESFVVRVPARMTPASQKPPTDQSIIHRKTDGSVSLVSLEFAREDFALVFETDKR